MAPEAWGIPDVSKQFIMNSNHFQMELGENNSYSQLESQGLYLGGEQTVKAWILIPSGWSLRQGIFQVFQGRS